MKNKNNQFNLASSLVNKVLDIKPIANLARQRARDMMIQRAGKIGVNWIANVEHLKSQNWSLDGIQNQDLNYPAYYTLPFHAYPEGNLDWEPAWEVESAALTVHSTIWSGNKNPQADGDAQLRDSYHENLIKYIKDQPHNVLDIGCSVGMSTFALQKVYSQAQLTGLDLSPYYLSVARHRAQKEQIKEIQWIHALAESTGLEESSYDLVSAFLLFHELPQRPTLEILQESYRLIKPGGYFAMMDMNPQSSIYREMPAYILTLLKSTEPHLDEYFTLDFASSLTKAGFVEVLIIANSPRHRTVIAQKPK
jgi:ubiquinone/menaquinone biosynthesis C-methylase UbiE